MSQNLEMWSNLVTRGLHVKRPNELISVKFDRNYMRRAVIECEHKVNEFRQQLIMSGPLCFEWLSSSLKIINEASTKHSKNRTALCLVSIHTQRHILRLIPHLEGLTCAWNAGTVFRCNYRQLRSDEFNTASQLVRLCGHGRSPVGVYPECYLR